MEAGALGTARGAQIPGDDALAMKSFAAAWGEGTGRESGTSWVGTTVPGPVLLWDPWEQLGWLVLPRLALPSSIAPLALGQLH